MILYAFYSFHRLPEINLVGHLEMMSKTQIDRNFCLFTTEIYNFKLAILTLHPMPSLLLGNSWQAVVEFDVAMEFCGFDKFKWLLDCTMFFVWTHSGGGADNENVTGSESVLVDVVALTFCGVNCCCCDVNDGNDCEADCCNDCCANVIDDNKFDRWKPVIPLSVPTPILIVVVVVVAVAVADWFIGTVAVPFIPNEKLFGKKFACILLSGGKVTANVGCGICILMHDRFSIETASPVLSFIEWWCSAVIVRGWAIVCCKFDICDVSMVGSAAVNSKPDDVGMKTGCANWAFVGPFATKCCVRSLWFVSGCVASWMRVGAGASFAWFDCCA